MHHFLLATDDEFKRLRKVRQMLRIIVYLNWFRRSLRDEENKGREIRFKCMKTNLSFPFGEKKVLGLAISLNYLSEYEKFEEKHILKACQRLIPHIRIVPHSFFSYETAGDTIRSFYIEIEKKEGKDFSADELKIFKNGLVTELGQSIEQLSHRLFMPHNEEEVLRNTLLLSQELRGPKDPPQIIVNFRNQTENSLTFHVIFVKLLTDMHAPLLDKQFLLSNDFITFVPGSKKVVGQLKNKIEKEAHTFLLECPKLPFLRQDHSVDLLRAREFIISSVRKIVGEVRDFNGGLIGQQNQLLKNLKDDFSTKEQKHELHLENLFHSITPVLMKSLLNPELIRALFQLFIKLYDESEEETLELRLKEVRLEHAHIMLIASEDCVILDELNGAISDLRLKELEFAETRFKVGTHYYQGYIVVPEQAESMQKFSKLINDRLHFYGKLKNLGQTMRISLPRPTTLLDPRIGTDRTSGIVIKMLYEGLARIDSNGKPALAVAERVTISPDQTRYTFHLRPTKWSNGKVVTAYDFEYGWKKFLDPHFTSHYAYLFYPIKHARAAKKGKLSLDYVGIQALDSMTLQVDLEHPAPYFLELIAHWVYSPLCKENDELHPGWAYYGGENFVCNGPFKLGKWKRNSEIQVVKNQDYWDAEFVHMRRIDISIIENPATAFEMYEKGELDWIGEPLSEIPQETLKKKGMTDKIFSHPISAVHWYDFNVKMAPFQSKKIRRALAIALNRQQIIDELLHGGEVPAYTILPPNLSLTNQAQFQDSNIELARRLFIEGLQELDMTPQDLPRITITCYDQELDEGLARAVARQWKEALGLEMSVKTLKWEQFLDKCLRHDFHIMATTWYSWFNDPLYSLEHTKYHTDDSSMTQWQNDGYDELLDKATTCLDLRERKKILREAEGIVMEEMPIIPLFYYTFKYMKKEHVNNIFLSHLGQIDFKWAYVNKPK